MTWANDLITNLGASIGAATLAGTMYAACAAAEKAASRQALVDISSVLKNPSWELSVRPSAMIERIFRWTFGERQLSWKCVGRSILATILVNIIFCCLFFPMISSNLHSMYEMFLEYDPWPRVGMIIGLLLMTAIPDYLSLAKTRMIIRMSRSGSFPVLTKLLLMDVFVGIMISILSVIICIEAGVVLLAIVGAQVEEVTTNAGITFGTDDSLSFLRSIYESNSSGAVRMVVEAIVKSIGHFLTGADSSIYTVQLTSTLLTSVWIFLILLSTTVLKLITPLHQFTSWFFDVEAHPLQAIGVIAGALVVVAALILSLIRAVI